jgi:hypothetical protein
MNLVRQVFVIFVALNLVLLMPPAYAASPSKDKAGQVSTQGPRRHLATIVFAGLAGAILGLSTLSFYGRPQDRLSNIAVGFAIGVITGTVYTTYKAATEPKDFYSVRGANPELWALEDSEHRQYMPTTPRTGLVFEF